MKLKIYGSRGSIPLFSREQTRFGGNTSCVRLDTNGKIIILDCGSGLEQLNWELQRERGKASGLELDILISHLHLDHIIGLSTFAPLWDKNNSIRIFTASRNAQPLSKQVFGLFKPPYWPVDLGERSLAVTEEVKPGEIFSLGGGITVTPLESAHCDSTTVFRIDADKSIVYAPDFEAEASPERFEALARLCENADAVIFDSTYLPEDYQSKRGWGHSSYEHGIALAERSGCKKMIFSHLGQNYSDNTLELSMGKINGINERYFLASDGMEIML